MKNDLPSNNLSKNSFSSKDDDNPALHPITKTPADDVDAITHEISTINRNSALSRSEKKQLRYEAFQRLVRNIARRSSENDTALGILSDRRLAVFKLNMEKWFSAMTSQLHQDVTREQVQFAVEIAENLQEFQDSLGDRNLSDRKRHALSQMAEKTFDLVIDRMARRIDDMWTND